jgi:hypothetical protein
MTKPLPITDFRAVRHVLQPHDFALGGDEDDPPPSDQIDPKIWARIMNLPDDVAIRTSDHNGTRLRLLYNLWGEWNGFYRAAISNLRRALELVMIGTFGNLRPKDMIYASRKKGTEERFGFSGCRRQLSEIYKGTKIEWLFTKTAFPALIYADLCRFTPARPEHLLNRARIMLQMGAPNCG